MNILVPGMSLGKKVNHLTLNFKRFGHAVAADLNKNIIYLMGGNASTHPLRPMKLSDFWKLDILDRWGIKHCLSNVSLQLHLHRYVLSIDINQLIII